MGEAVPDRAEPVVDIISDEEEEEDPEEREPLLQRKKIHRFVPTQGGSSRLVRFLP